MTYEPSKKVMSSADHNGCKTILPLNTKIHCFIMSAADMLNLSVILYSDRSYITIRSLLVSLSWNERQLLIFPYKHGYGLSLSPDLRLFGIVDAAIFYICLFLYVIF